MTRTITARERVRGKALRRNYDPSFVGCGCGMCWTSKRELADRNRDFRGPGGSCAVGPPPMSLVSSIYRMSVPEIVTAEDVERRLRAKLRRLNEQLGPTAVILAMSNATVRKDDEPLRERLIAMTRENPAPASHSAT